MFVMEWSMDEVAEKALSYVITEPEVSIKYIC